MRNVRHTALAALLIGAALMAGCSPKQPAKPAPQTGTQTKPAKSRPELVAPIEGSLTALREMNTAGKNKDIPGSKARFLEFRNHWKVVKAELEKEDPKLAVHIEDGAIELDHEFTKPVDQFRFYELDEETVKLGRLLSGAATLLGAQIRPDLVQKDPTQEIPFNQERRIEVSLVDHRIQPDVIKVEQHTKVTFVITNRGKDPHEFALGHYGVEVEDLLAGQTKELTLVLLDAGEFETACYFPGHYEVGMHGKLIVTPAELKKK
ncbi:MAG TPA: cupredoxin domain-containing protein [Symbiobacteriaceae bacterium]|nr:cupredoxin domain-containing protein [Symbiobacteriaceae bacterium]